MLNDLIPVSRHNHSGVGRICELFLAKWCSFGKTKIVIYYKVASNFELICDTRGRLSIGAGIWRIRSRPPSAFIFHLAYLTMDSMQSRRRKIVPSLPCHPARNIDS